MRIGVLTTSYPRWAEDSAGCFVHGLNRWLLRRGHQVAVVAAGEDGKRASNPELLDGVLVQRVSSTLFFHGGAPDELAHGGLVAKVAALRFSSTQLLQALRVLHDCDALIAHWLVPCGVTAALVAAGRPVVAIAHSSDIHLLRRLRAEAVVRALSRRARLCYTSASLQVPGAPGVVVPMGLQTAAFTPKPGERAAARKALGLQQPTLLVLSRLVPVKGLDVLLRALAQVPEVQLQLAGTGPLAAELQALSQQLGLQARVHFLGEVHGEQKRQLLHGCDALVLPSRVLPDGRTDSAPLAVMEALAAGCPVIASAIGGLPQLVQGAGLLVPPDDVQSLQDALQRVREPTWRHQCQQQALLLAPQLDWETLGPRLLGPQLMG